MEAFWRNSKEITRAVRTVFSVRNLRTYIANYQLCLQDEIGTIIGR